MNFSYVTQYYSALLDSPSNVVLAISKSVSAIGFLNECTPDTSVAFSINFPNYTKSFFHRAIFSAIMKLGDYSRWTWDRKTRTFSKTRKGVLNDHIIAKSRLAESKCHTINKIINNLNSARFNVGTGVQFQETVYLTKKMQAAVFKNSGYDEDLIIEYPYVLQYADYANLSLRQATEDILLKAKLDDELLAKTELLRLKYFNKIKKATAPDQLPVIYEEFICDCYQRTGIK